MLLLLLLSYRTIFLRIETRQEIEFFLANQDERISDLPTPPSFQSSHYAHSHHSFHLSYINTRFDVCLFT